MKQKLLIFLLLLLAGTAEVCGQGTPAYFKAGGTGSNSFPFNTTSVKRSQHLYLPGDLPGAFSGNIIRMYVRASTASSGSTFSDLVIRMGQSTTTVFPGTGGLNFFTGLTPVLTAASFTIPSSAIDGWVPIDLQVPFLYNASQTLIVEVEMSNKTAGGFSVRTSTASAAPNHKRLTATSLTATTGSASTIWTDFGVDIIPSTPCSGTPVAGNAIASATIACPNTSFLLSLDGNVFASGLTYQWQISANGTSGWTNIPGATNFTYSATQTSTNFYRAVVTCSGGASANSGSVQVSTSSTAVSGIFTIDKNATNPSSTVFTSFASAITSMECGGVNGPVVFNVAPNSGPYNEKITVPAIPGTSATNTITFNGNGNTIIGSTSSTTDGLLTLDGSKYIRFNNLNINASSSSTSGSGINLTNGAQFNKFVGNTVTLSTTSTTTSYGIRLQTGANHDNLFQNNTVIGGYYGLYSYGASGTPITNNQFIGNEFRDTYYYGMYLYYNNNATVEGNEIHRPTRISGTTFYGLYGSYSLSLQISKNRIHDTGSSTIYGIYNYYSDSPAASPTIVKNNLVYNLNNTGTTYAIYNTSSDGVHYYHNTVSLDEQNSASGITRGFYQLTSASNIRFINNNISLTRNTSGAKHALYFGTTTSGITSNNNNLYVPNGNVGYYSTAYATLANWQTANSGAFDQNSVAANPVFINLATGNLRPNTVAVDNIGQSGTGVTDDILGNPRSTSTPDLGAYEFSVPVNDVSVVRISGPVSGCGLTANESISVTIRNFGSATQNNVPLSYKVNGTQIDAGNWTGTLAPNDTAVFTFAQTTDMSNPGSYLIQALASLSTDTNASNDTLSLTIGNALLPGMPFTFDFETPATSAGAMRVVTNSNSNISENAAASNGTGSTKGMVMEGVSSTQWVTPAGILDPWAYNPDHFSAVYLCFTPNTAQKDTLFMTFHLKQLYKDSHYNTNFRVTVNGQQVGPTYKPPFGGYDSLGAPWDTIRINLNQFKQMGSIQIGLESSVKEEFANGNGTANLVDNINIFNAAGPTGIKENPLQNSLVIFPNPSNGQFNLKVPATTRSYTVEVTDLTGKVIKQQIVKNNSGTEQLNLNNTAKGIYILKIASEGNVATRKLIVE